MYEDYIPEERRGFSMVRELFDWVESGLTAVMCVVLLFTFAGRMVGVIGDSMLPTLKGGDRLISTRLYGELQRGDIVIITKPNLHHYPLVKRVIATGGQTIDIDDETGEVYVNAKKLSEDSYILEKIAPGSRFDMKFPQVVPLGYVFVMGDNRNDSNDSRFAEVGMVDERYILGKVVYQVWPLERFGDPYES